MSAHLLSPPPHYPLLSPLLSVMTHETPTESVVSPVSPGQSKSLLTTMDLCTNPIFYSLLTLHALYLFPQDVLISVVIHEPLSEEKLSVS